MKVESKPTAAAGLPPWKVKKDAGADVGAGIGTGASVVNKKPAAVASLSAFEQIMIHVLRNKKLSVSEMLAVMYASGTGSTLQAAREQLLAILEVDELPKGEALERQREEIEGIIIRLALDYHGIKNVPPLKAQLNETWRAKYDRALGTLKAQFHIMVNKKVEEQVEIEVLKRLPDEERRYIAEMESAMTAHRDIFFGMPQIEALYKAFQPYLENEKLMLHALHPDRAPPERREEFGQAMSVFNSVREALTRISDTNRRLLSHIWPVKK